MPSCLCAPSRIYCTERDASKKMSVGVSARLVDAWACGQAGVCLIDASGRDWTATESATARSFISGKPTCRCVNQGTGHRPIGGVTQVPVASSCRVWRARPFVEQPDAQDSRRGELLSRCRSHQIAPTLRFRQRSHLRANKRIPSRFRRQKGQPFWVLPPNQALGHTNTKSAGVPAVGASRMMVWSSVRTLAQRTRMGLTMPALT